MANLFVFLSLLLLFVLMMVSKNHASIQMEDFDHESIEKSHKKFIRCGVHTTVDEIHAYENHHHKSFMAMKDRINLDAISLTPINVYFHVIISSTGAGDVSDSQLASQIDVLNHAFAGLNAKFILKKTNRVVNDIWFTSSDKINEEAKSALHTGSLADLNVYTANIVEGSGTIGYAYLPQTVQNNPTIDGVVLQYSTLPGIINYITFKR